LLRAVEARYGIRADNLTKRWIGIRGYQDGGLVGDGRLQTADSSRFLAKGGMADGIQDNLHKKQYTNRFASVNIGSKRHIGRTEDGNALGKMEANGEHLVTYRRRGGRVGEGKVTKDSHQAMLDVVKDIVSVTTKPSNVGDTRTYKYLSPQLQQEIDAGIPHPDEERLSRRALGVISNTLLRAGVQPTVESVQKAIGSFRTVKLDDVLLAKLGSKGYAGTVDTISISRELLNDPRRTGKPL